MQQKTNADVDRLTTLFSIADSVSKPNYERIAKLVNDLGIDRAERALLILSGENPDSPLNRNALSGKQSGAVLTKEKRAPSSLVERSMQQKSTGNQSLIDRLVKGDK